MNTPTTLLLFAIAAAAADGIAQTRVEPAVPAAQPPSPAPTLEQELAKFREPASWADGFRGLVALARQQQQDVLEAIAPSSRPGGDRDLTARSRLLIEAIAVQHSAAEKREELRQRFRRVGDAASDTEKALGADASEALKKAVAALQVAVATMQKNLQVDGPMAPTPLRVPVRNDGVPPAAPPASERTVDGYREIDVDGKKMLVPADALPAGSEFAAEMTERGLVVKKKVKAAAKPAAGDKPKEEGKKQAADEKKNENGKSGGGAQSGNGGN